VLSTLALAAISAAYILFANQLGQTRQALVPFFGLLVFACAFDAGPLARFLGARPMVLLGEISYGIYILQRPLIPWFKRFGSARITAFPWLRFALYVIFLTSVSYAAYRWIETPIRRWGRRGHSPRAVVTQPNAAA
jgi:peptidoglycan/LPS O-acetylase OafA/YrhL